LINAARNGKSVVVMLELKARFDEEANLEWKDRLELEGVKVLIGVDNLKVHAKICMIRKKSEKKVIQYGFVSTGNFNEQTARFYGDHCMLTSNRRVMTDINKIFKFLENPKIGFDSLKSCDTLLVCPVTMRSHIESLIEHEIKLAKAKKSASIKLKVNSLSDPRLIEKLYEAAHAGVDIQIVVRGIFCVVTDNPKFKQPIKAVSIIDEYLEHARVMIFENGGKEKVFISSADWMVRNLDHRVEVAIPVLNKSIRKELSDIINIQLSDNVKARTLDNSLSNHYVEHTTDKKIRSQIETYKYLYKKQKEINPEHDNAEKADVIEEIFDHQNGEL
jgi:polyphosphate kinase